MRDRGFTLIESLVAITVLTVAIAAPLTLASQSLSAAYNARDQVIAFNLAQDAMETVRAQRDHNLLAKIAGQNTDWLTGLPVRLVGDAPKPFVVDSYSRNRPNFIECGGSCSVLKFDSSSGLYGQYTGDDTKFTRVVNIDEVPDTSRQEVRVQVVVSWQSGTTSTREVVIEENLYNWIAGITQ